MSSKILCQIGREIYRVHGYTEISSENTALRRTIRPILQLATHTQFNYTANNGFTDAMMQGKYFNKQIINFANKWKSCAFEEES